jgi:AMMECR1 domain-containing protein
MDDACAMTCAVATTSMQVCLDKFRGVFGTKEDVKSLADHLETVSRNASAAAVEARRCAGEELGTQEVTNIPVNIPSTNTADPLAAASFNLMSF